LAFNRDAGTLVVAVGIVLTGASALWTLITALG
jgi:hypothetical protein